VEVVHRAMLEVTDEEILACRYTALVTLFIRSPVIADLRIRSVKQCHQRVEAVQKVRDSALTVCIPVRRRNYERSSPSVGIVFKGQVAFYQRTTVESRRSTATKATPSPSAGRQALFESARDASAGVPRQVPEFQPGPCHERTNDHGRTKSPDTATPSIARVCPAALPGSHFHVVAHVRQIRATCAAMWRRP